MRPSRRRLLTTALAASVLPLAGRSWAAAPKLATPVCDDGDEPTKAGTEGPFFKADAPMRQDLAADGAGERLSVGGFVLDRQCRPLAGAAVQIWHADADGRYDNRGYRFRGWQRTDEAGRWWFSTIVPAVYPGRTRHYHMKVERPSGDMLTTQLFFPGEPGNARDWLYDSRLDLRMLDDAAGRMGRFDFIV